LDDRGLRPGHDRDLALGVELDAVDVAVAAGDRLAQAWEAAEGRVAVHVRPGSRPLQRLDDVRRRADLRIAAAEVDHVDAGLGHAAQERGEVLRRQALEPFGAGTHGAIVDSALWTRRRGRST